MSKIALSILSLDISLAAVKYTVRNGSGELSDRLAWAAGELERLAGECYRLADEADEGELPDGPLPGFDT